MQLKLRLTEEREKFITGAEAGLSLLLMAAVPAVIKFNSATPLTIGLFRLAVATTLIVVFLRPGAESRPFTYRMIMPLLLIGLFFALHWITYFLSIKKATATIGLLGISTYGIHLIFLGWAVRKNKPGLFDYVALLIALTGTYLVVPDFSLRDSTSLGILLAIFSGFCFAVLPVLHQRYAYIPERIRIFGQFFVALLVFSALSPWTNWQLSTIDWWALLYLAIPGTFIAHTLWVRVTTRLSTTVTSLIFYLLIPLTMITSHFWLGEPMPLMKIIGALLIVSGNLLSLSRKAIKR